jgi:hypothetical protein
MKIFFRAGRYRPGSASASYKLSEKRFEKSGEIIGSIDANQVVIHRLTRAGRYIILCAAEGIEASTYLHKQLILT